MLKSLMIVFLGGGIGSAFRYATQVCLHERILPYQFPYATLTVNVLGCFFIGLFYAWSARFNWNPEWRLLLTTGLCGGFTTFSTFCNDGLLMYRQGAIGWFIFYFILSLTLGLLAVVAGGWIGNK